VLYFTHSQAGWPAEQLNALDRHERILDMDNVWTDPPGLEQFYAHGPRRFEGGWRPVEIGNGWVQVKSGQLHAACCTVLSVCKLC
jgi:hypothetical protein